MLQIKKIFKQYKTGELIQTALKGVSLNLRDNEFVSILGPSGSGKTTLLNIIGGLDRYDSGDLIINDISTKNYKDRDWDAYRNHTIGFVFQSYNLIPHQSVLANVELALTIGGISASERKERAKKALEEVGLGDQLHKKPSQMSGGQMQRVAIARALVNDPDILLADEPTGALDTETSIQVMDLLKKVAKDRLVVMVTHNPELAEQYSTRIVKLRDGEIVSDSNPYEPENEPQAQHKKVGKAKMGFGTSLALSFNNLKTKKARTILTSFAGSIGIIGIALVLALSTGVNQYITDIQKETMTSYPITISSTALDLSSMAGGSKAGGKPSKSESSSEDGVHASNKNLEENANTNASLAENDLAAFKTYLEDEDSEIHQYVGENGIVYSYDVSFSVYSYDEDGNLVSTGAETENIIESDSAFGDLINSRNLAISSMSTLMGTSTSGAENFEEMIPGTNDTLISPVITESYDLLAGSWPQSYDEVVLVLDENNSIATETLYQLGLISKEEYKEITDQISDDKKAESIDLDFDEILDHTFYLMSASDFYVENEDGTFSYAEEGTEEFDAQIENALPIKISGIIRPMEDANNASLTNPIGYTSALTSYIMDHTANSNVVLAQEADEDTNVLSGFDFEAKDDAQKVKDAKAYISELGISDKASLYSLVAMNSSDTTQSMDAAALAQMSQASMDETSMAAMLDAWLESTDDSDLLVSFYDEYIGGSSYEDNMEAFGKVSFDTPSSISIYTDSFEDKEGVSAAIEDYNKTVDEEQQITYTDYVALMTSSLTSIIDMISYVLIAFIAVSLIVSCIMIGIITHISVLERTKEIGILRALGASKANISQVFNAETLLIGLFSGLIGVGVSALLTIPINSIIAKVLESNDLTVALPMQYALVLVLISVVITMLGGWIPAKKAAKKDPVIALRTE
jgi:putative ABC transport system permease protein